MRVMDHGPLCWRGRCTSAPSNHQYGQAGLLKIWKTAKAGDGVCANGDVPWTGRFCMRSRAGTARAAGARINAVDREQMGRGMLLPPAHEVQWPGDTWEGTEQINPGSEEVEELEVEEEAAGTWWASSRGGRHARLVLPHCFGGHPAVALVVMLCPGSRPHTALGTRGEDRTPGDVEPLQVTSVGSCGIFSLWAFCPQHRAETCPARCTSAGVAGGAGSVLGTPPNCLRSFAGPRNTLQHSD